MTQLRIWVLALMAAAALLTCACDGDTDANTDADANEEDSAAYSRAICEKLDACGYMNIIYYANTTVEECVLDFDAQIATVKESMPACVAQNQVLMKCVSELGSCESVSKYWTGAPGTGAPYPCRTADVQYNDCVSTAQGF